MILSRVALGVLFAALLPVMFSPAAVASFTAYRFAHNYIIVGTDNRSIGANASDRYCKIRILDDAHFFIGEGIQFIDHVNMADLAERVFDDRHNISTGELVEAWMPKAELVLQTALTKHPEDSTQPGAFLPLTKGFFGEVRSGGSRWSAGMVAMNEDRTTWKRDKVLNEGARPDFISQSDDRELAAQFALENRVTATENVEVDAKTMQKLVQFVIDHTPHSYVGGEPVVLILEYGEKPRWFAGGDICKGTR